MRKSVAIFLIILAALAVLAVSFGPELMTAVKTPEAKKNPIATNKIDFGKNLQECLDNASRWFGAAMGECDPQDQKCVDSVNKGLENYKKACNTRYESEATPPVCTDGTC